VLIEHVRSSAACFIDLGPVPGEAWSRRPARPSHFGCARWSCDSHLACAGRASPGPGEAQEGSVVLQAPLPSRLANQWWIEHRRTYELHSGTGALSVLHILERLTMELTPGDLLEFGAQHVWPDDDLPTTLVGGRRPVARGGLRDTGVRRTTVLEPTVMARVDLPPGRLATVFTDVEGPPIPQAPDGPRQPSSDCFEDPDFPGLCAHHEVHHLANGSDLDMCRGEVPRRL
jgi:hypothetical protein